MSQIPGQLNARSRAEIVREVLRQGSARYQNGTVTDLNTLIPADSGVTLITAASINDQGVIVGTAINARGLEVGYELTPAG